jgi:hypothetical protein
MMDATFNGHQISELRAAEGIWAHRGWSGATWSSACFGGGQGRRRKYPSSFGLQRRVTTMAVVRLALAVATKSPQGAVVATVSVCIRRRAQSLIRSSPHLVSTRLRLL